MLAFLRRDLKVALSYRLQFFLQVASVLSLSITFFFLSLMLGRAEAQIASLGKYGGRYFGFVLVGLAFSTFLDGTLRTFSFSIRQAQITGTLEAMLTTRARIGAVVAGSALYTLLSTSIRTLLFGVFGVVVFQQRLHFDAWPAVVAVFVLTVLCTLALGIFSAGFIVLFKQGDPVTGAISGLSWLLSGVLYPKEILPVWVQRFADLLPLTHTLESMRLALLTGADLEDLRRSMAYLTVFAALGIPLAVLWFGWAVGRARVAGSLAKY